MGKQKFAYAPSQLVILLLCISIFNPWITSAADAQQVDVRRLDQYYKVERSNGTRLDKIKNRRCKSCEEEEANAKSEYLQRAISGGSSVTYQREIESLIFADSKFVNRCWKNAIDNGMEFFFTVEESGVASDFAWFPKQSAGRCIKKHISKIEFPTLDKPHHSWLVVSGITQ